jgi:hypothetical protein
MHRYIRTTLRGRLTVLVAICSVAMALIGAGPAHARGRYQLQLDQAQQLLQPPATNASRLSIGSNDMNTVRPLPLPCDRLAPAPLCLPPVPTSTVRCHDWTVSRLPGDRPQLVVSAVCAVRGGERLELRRLDPQGINPADLLLELVVQRSPFPDGPPSTEVRISHVEPDAGYKTVTILPDGPTLPVDELD